MKIALVCRIHPTHRPGGMPFVFEDRARALAAAGHTVHCLTTSLRRGRGSETRVNDNLTIHYMPARPMRNSDEFAAHCHQHCSIWKPDIIHMDSLDIDRWWWRDRPGNPQCIACTLHGAGMGNWLTYWTMHRARGKAPPPPFDPAGMLRETAAFKTFDVVIGISLHEQWLLRDPQGITGAKLVYNPIPAYFFRDKTPVAPPPPPDQRRRFLCAAVSGQDERGFSIAAEAAKMAGVELEIVNDVPREKMPAVYDRCNALVLPTAWCQGLDLTCCEALARERPVICSAVGSYLRESEPPGIWQGATVLVPAGDVAAVAAAMKGPLPAFGITQSWQHRPENHVQNWLAAVGA